MTDPWTRPGEPEPQRQASGPQQPGYTNPSFPQGYPEPSQPTAPGNPEPSAYEQPPAYNPYGQPTGFQAGQLTPAQQSPYGYQAGYPNQAPEHPYAVPTLVISLVGFFTGIAFPIAWILGAKATSEMNRNPGRWRPSSTLTAGKWIGIIGTLLGVLVAVAVVLFVLIAVVASASTVGG